MRRCYVHAVVLTFFALLVTGCGGGGGRSASLPGGGGTQSSKTGQVPTQFKITFSNASNTASTARKPKTISSSSESVVITVNGGLQQTFNIAAPQCTIGDTITCDFTVNAYVGSDTFLIQTYSGPNGTGTLLDQVTFAFTVSATGNNTLSATLGPAVSTTADSGTGSLRAAIAAANPGDTISFAPSLSGTITLTSGAITLAQNITVSGPGASTITVSGNNASNIFTVNSGVTATISGLMLANGAGAACAGNSSDTCGGAIQNEGTLTVNNATFTNNTASPAAFGEGGAIYNDTGATLSVTNSTFSGNKAQFGGAIGSESPNATIAGSTFTSNTAQGGQDDYPFTYGGAVYSDDDMTITGSTFSTNLATGGGSSNFGAAIAEDDCTNSGLTLTGSTLKSNQSGVPANGDASGNGGAVYDDSGCTMQLTSDAFTSNVASGTSDSYGGAVEADSYSSIALLGGNTFTSNSVVSQSTNQYSAGGAIDITPYGANLVISGSGNTFTGNSVTAGPSESGGDANGGAIDLDSGGYLDMSAATGTTFSQNVASAPDSQGSAFGGAIEYFVSQQGQGCGDDCSKYRKSGPAAAHHFGRLLAARALARQPQFHAHGSAKAIARESTRRRPAVVAQQQLSNTVMATFTQNKATGGSSSEYDVTGGAIDIEEALSFTIVSSTFTGNQVGPSNSWGGAVSVEGSTMTLTGDIFTANSATNGGGAVAFNDTTMTLSASTLSQNSVTSAFYTGDGGGGIYASGASENTVTQSTIGSNTVAGNVTGTGGGGVIINDAMIQFTNDTITGNTSAMDGGGLEISSVGGCVILTNVTLYANTATNGDGGSLFLGGGNATITNSIFARGAAKVGPDIVSPTATITSNDWNYIATTPNGPFATTGPDDQINAGEITLAALANNGGSTQTMSDAGVSAVVDVIPFDGSCGNSSVTQDQRGLYRGAVNSSCDIGAYENGGTTTAPTSIVRQTTTKLKR
ncbi:MAG: choice-of-anchor Q domain-containing protein [Vulcanimicrobiaceae bacterium]|jgi:hypothetical protein